MGNSGLSAVGQPFVAAAGLLPGSGNRKPDSPSRIHEAAQQFESLLISQILKTSHEDGEGWLSAGEDDEAAGSGMAMAEEQFARALGTRGGLGLAPLIEKGLTKSMNGNDG